MSLSSPEEQQTQSSSAPEATVDMPDEPGLAQSRFQVLRRILWKPKALYYSALASIILSWAASTVQLGIMLILSRMRLGHRDYAIMCLYLFPPLPFIAGICFLLKAINGSSTWLAITKKHVIFSFVIAICLFLYVSLVSWFIPNHRVAMQCLFHGEFFWFPSYCVFAATVEFVTWLPIFAMFVATWLTYRRAVETQEQPGRWKDLNVNEVEQIYAGSRIRL